MTRRWTAAAAALLWACAGAAQATATSGRDGQIAALWPVTVAQYLRDDLENEALAYDASHALVLPMAYAFDGCKPERYRLREDFHRFFARLREKTSLVISNGLTRMQFAYFSALYLRLSSTCNELSVEGKQLRSWLGEMVRMHWHETPIPHWSQGLSLLGVRSSLGWKSNVKSPERSYYRAIVDEELFTLGAAAELASGSARAGAEVAGWMRQAVEAFATVVASEGAFSYDGLWRFQAGVWSGHPDYAFAGHDEPTAGLERKLVPDIAWDSSHAHRMPLLLQSLARASIALEDDDSAAVACRAHQGFVRQFERIIVDASSDFRGPRIANFIDGRNGVYRYGYATVGGNRGYGPYELSGVLFEGWYALMGSRKLKRAYERLSFPLAPNVIRTYVGPNTTRKRHRLVQWPDYFNNGFAQLHALAAIDVSTPDICNSDTARRSRSAP